jgi:CheY-like chemotaxis protein
MKKVLVADDAEDVRLMLTVFLRAEGFDVTAAVDGMDAVNAFMCGGFDAVILDCSMPQMDGPSAAQVMRHIETLKGVDATRIGFLTGHYRSEEFERTQRKLDVSRFWEKPIDPPLFAADLREWLAVDR